MATFEGRRMTHRDSPSKLPWNNYGTQSDDLLLDCDDSDDENVIELKTTTMSRDDVNRDQYLQAQYTEAITSWTDEHVRAMIHDVQEQGVDWWLKEYVVRRRIEPRKLLLAFGLIFSKTTGDLDNEHILKILKMTLLRVVRKRERLTKYNTIQDVVNLIRKSERIMVLSGAAVSSGIPDFRSKNGLYQMLKSSYEYDLDDPQQMFDLEYFKENPSVFYSFAKEIYPSNHEPSPAHRFIRLLEMKDKLLRNYTQNIDDLESVAGIRTVLQCHGSFAKATCLQCGAQYPGKHIEKAVLAQEVPFCTKCSQPKPPKKRKIAKTWNGGDETTSSEEQDDIPGAIIKPNITFFGEKLTDEFDDLLRVDRTKVDLLIVMGTSLKVTPVSEILSHIPHSVPQILINKTPIKHMNADIVLLGNADAIVEYLCAGVLGPDWELPVPSNPLPVSSKRKSPGDKPQPPERVENSHVWLFEGAEGGDFVTSLRARSAQTPTWSSSSPLRTNGVNTQASGSSRAKKQRTN